MNIKQNAAAICFFLIAAASWTQEPEAKPILAVLDFTVSGISSGEGALISDMLTSHLVRTGAYRVIDRRERDAILKEIEFSVSDCSEESCQLEVGRLLAASRIVVGSIGILGNIFLVSMRLLEVESGEALEGISEKYPSLDSLAGDGERLAAVLSGKAEAAVFRPLTAQSLISSAKAEEQAARLALLQRRVKPADYAEWLKQKGFAGYERDAVVEEKLVFLEEFISQANTRGHAIDIMLAGMFPAGRDTTVGSYPGIEQVSTCWGATLGWTYQYSNRYSIGAFASVTTGRWYQEQYHPSWGTQSTAASATSLCAGPTTVLGDKVLGAAFLASLGVGSILFGGYGSHIGPCVRAGGYFRCFYFGGLCFFDVGGDWAHYQLEAGYSIFLGRRRSWPLRQ